MEFFETVSKRKTIRKYKKEHPPIEDIKKIIDSARLAPSATNTQNWKFIAIYNNEIKQKMAQAVLDTYDEYESKINDEEVKNRFVKYKPHSIFFKDAPVVIACVETYKESPVTDYMKKIGMPDEEIFQMKPDSSLLSMGGAIENMSLAATELGYGSCWMCAPIIAYKQFKKILQLDKTDKIVSLLTVGKPDNENNQHPPKKTLEEIITIIQ